MAYFSRNSISPLILVFLAFQSTARGEDKNVAKISLQLNQDYKQPVYRVSHKIDFEAGQRIASRYPFADKVGVAPGKVFVTIETPPDLEDAYLIRIDSDGDGDLLEETGHLLAIDSPIVVEVQRKWEGRADRKLKYTVYCRAWEDSEGNRQEMFLWKPHYRAEGRLRCGKSENLIAVLDFNGNGVFDTRDFRSLRSINIDRDGDGIFSNDERFSGHQVISYCGDNFLIKEISKDGSYIKWENTSMTMPELGNRVPPFILKTNSGKTISSRSLKGTHYVLTFWGYWCVPCVEAFPLLQKEDFEQVQVIAINIDEKQDLERAMEIVERYKGAWPQVVSGKGYSDPLWKLFGSIRDIRSTVPLYVLVDDEGKLRYAGFGGEKLDELSENIRKVIAHGTQ